MILTEECEICGSEIEVITFIEDNKKSPNYKQKCVSHGVCTGCFTNIIMSNESVLQYNQWGLIKRR